MKHKFSGNTNGFIMKLIILNLFSSRDLVLMTTWLVVEDELDLLDMFEAAAELMGVNSLCFSSGEDAIDWIDGLEGGRFGGEKPDLALLDIRLSGDRSEEHTSELQ